MKSALREPAFNIGQRPVPSRWIGFQSNGDGLPADLRIGAEAVEIMGAMHDSKVTWIRSGGNRLGGSDFFGMGFQTRRGVGPGSACRGMGCSKNWLDMQSCAAHEEFWLPKKRGGVKATALGGGGDASALAGRCGHGLMAGESASGVSRFVFPFPGQELGNEGANGGNGIPAVGNEKETGEPVEGRLWKRHHPLAKRIRKLWGRRQGKLGGRFSCDGDGLRFGLGGR